MVLDCVNKGGGSKLLGKGEKVGLAVPRRKERDVGEKVVINLYNDTNLEINIVTLR